VSRAAITPRGAQFLREARSRSTDALLDAYLTLDKSERRRLDDALEALDRLSTILSAEAHH